MDIRKWCSSGTRTIQLGSSVPSGSGWSKLKWKMLWIRILKQKKTTTKTKTKVSESAPPLHLPYYDPHSYSQNFDHGSALDEPDNLSRSFSARFADPSTLLVKKAPV